MSEYDVQKDVEMKTRDGVILRQDLYRPVRDGRTGEKFPTILVRTPYNKESADLEEKIGVEELLSEGYCVLLQDVRGRWKSDGVYYHGIYEANDGYDTVEWIAAQPWSNGKVGMTGASYLAAVQDAAAIAGPPHLASLFHVKGPLDYYQMCFRRGGAYLMYMGITIFWFGTTSKEAAKDPTLAKQCAKAEEDSLEWLSRELRKGLTPLSRLPELERWLIDIIEHADYDSFWKSVPLWESIEFLEEYANVAGYHVGGWYDPFRENEFYAALADKKKGPIKLLMGPWTHMDFGRVSGDVDFGPDAEISQDEYVKLQLRWFDQTLRGMNDGMLSGPPVRIFVMGGGDGRRTKEGRMNHGGRWRYENEWPLARTRYLAHYFHRDGTLTTTRPEDGDSATCYSYDPRNPVPTIGGSCWFRHAQTPPRPGESTPRGKPFVPQGAYDQRESPHYFGCTTDLPLSSRHDVLVFQTQPLQEQVEVTGRISVKLWASSTAVDTDFTAKLIDVYPPSDDYPEAYAMYLTDGVIRARYRNSFERPLLMEPGKVYEFNVVLPETSNLFVKEHRIRVDVSSSNFPQFDPNPNTGDSFARGRTIIADNTVYHDSSHPSHIILPVIQSDG